jgi:lysine 6-dehydrogenase
VRVLVLGGCGIQGRTAVVDLARSTGVTEVVCADARLEPLEAIGKITDMDKVRAVALDVNRPDQLQSVFVGADVAIDLLPRVFMETVCRAAIAARVDVVNTNYAAGIAHLDRPAREAGVAVMPEAGLDPGIDLVVYGEAAKRFDRLDAIHSYCGGIPEADACDNPLNYKISWVWEGVLSSTFRDARLIRRGREVALPALDQHSPEAIHLVDFPGLGVLEAIPNGDAVAFVDQLGLRETVTETGRYSLRWPGWAAFWHPLKQLGFFSRQPVAGLVGDVSPYDMLDRLLGPQLQYRDHERDLVVMLNVFEGLRGGRRTRLTSRMLIERDLTSGLMAMSMGVGYTASIVAQMVAGGTIGGKGVLSPMRDIPYREFTDALARRGVGLEEEETDLG